jgi:hypothetical protein
MNRFRKQTDEKILLKAPIIYLKGEQTFKAIMFQGAAMDCKAFLTSQRFVALHERKWHMLGGLTFVIALFIPKKIVFEIPLEDLASVRHGEAKVSHELIMTTTDGTEFTIRFDGLKDTFGGDSRKVWIETIGEAMQEAWPEIEVQVNETTLERRSETIEAV